tara:strand:- start:1321 stop:1701 length:381 start_codon:yes stop_codon:yes gene_type:complete
MSGLNSVVDKIVSDVFSGKLISGLDLTKTGTYKNVSTGAYTASSRTLSKTETEVPIEIIPQKEKSDQFGGGQTDEIMFLVRPIDGVLPKQGIDDEVVIGGDTFKVRNVKQKSMGDTTLLYEITAYG